MGLEKEKVSLRSLVIKHGSSPAYQRGQIGFLAQAQLIIKYHLIPSPLLSHVHLSPSGTLGEKGWLNEDWLQTFLGPVTRYHLKLPKAHNGP